MTPKSLLRHPRCISSVNDLSEGSFCNIIDDNIEKDNVRKIVLCSGKIYYELLEHRENLNNREIAIVRIEQLYPLDINEIENIYSKYNKCSLFWVKKSPKIWVLGHLFYLN